MFTLCAKIREKKGKNSSRQLRRMYDKFPSVIYGHNKPSMFIELDHNKVIYVEKKSVFYTNPLIINIGHLKYIVKVQSVQKHPYKLKILHIDFIYFNKQ